MREITIIAHNVRSCENVGSILRTADGLKASVYLSGYTPHPAVKNDPRMPHEVAKLTRQITKTSLGAEKSVNWQWNPSLETIVSKLKKDGFEIVALEQAAISIKISEFKPTQKITVIVGNELSGLEKSELELADKIIEIPMFGKKESFNVASSAAMALFYFRFAK